MRTLCGILCFFLCVYIMTFARVINVQDGFITMHSKGIERRQPRMVQKLVLTVPRPPETGLMKTYSVKWIAIPFGFGLYCIYRGEKESRSKAVGASR